MWILAGSVPLFTVFGIRVRAHASLIIVIAGVLLFSETSGGLGPRNAVVSMTILFGSVLLHEFGHCFAARWMGGSADDILMSPLGGLAAADPPHRPWPSFVTTAAGPGVNLLICILTGTALAILNTQSDDAIPWFPVREGLRSYIPHDAMTSYIWWVFLVNYALLVFNMLLVFYPFDAGRMIQEILWAIVGYYKSMRIAVVIGMIGAAIVGMIAIATLSLLLFSIAFFGFWQCKKQREMLLEAGPYGFEDMDYGVSYSAAPYREKKASRRAQRRRERDARQRQVEQKRVDEILAKVSAHGMHSLNWMEKRVLKKASERMR
jgi:Zn-dependent protease